MSENSLPLGWEQVKVRDILEVHYGKGLTKAKRNETGSIPVYGSNGQVGQHDTALVEGPSIIIGRKGAAGAVHITKTSCWPIDTTYYTQPPDGLSLEYVYYVLGMLNLVSLDKSTAIPGLNRDDLYAQSFPLPPLAEQGRIVAEIEKQLTRLEAGVAALKQAQARLQRYKAAVLKAACEGRLVEQDPADEPASVLLVRILTERREKWEEEQWKKEIDKAKQKAAKEARKAAERPLKRREKLAPEEWENLTEEEYSNYLPKNDKWKQRYKEPEPPDLSTYPYSSELPENWVWVRVGQFTWSVKDGPHYSPSYVDEGIPFITGGNVRPNGVDFDNAKRITPTLHKELSKRCKPEIGDILYTKGGTTGIARVNTYDKEFNVWVHVAVLKLADSIKPFYIQHALNSPPCYAQAQRYTHGVGNQDLGLTRMVNIVFGLPPLAEQQRIVEEVERRLSVVEEVEGAIAANLKRAERLRQAVLRQAFEGRLVPQDPSDEPASALLERIRQAKVEAEGKKRQGSQMRLPGV